MGSHEAAKPYISSHGRRGSLGFYSWYMLWDAVSGGLAYAVTCSLTESPSAHASGRQSLGPAHHALQAYNA